MKKFIIEFYEKENGEIPVEEFLLSLNTKMRAKVLGIMEILQEKGNMLREPYIYKWICEEDTKDTCARNRKGEKV